jgi:hypothetical protein
MLWQEGYGKGSWFVGYGCESLAGEDQYMIWEKIRLGKNIIDGVYALFKHMRVLGIVHVK